MTSTNTSTTVRIDKWLWAARFFKTRSLAKQAIEGGKVHYNGQRIKTSKNVELDAELTIRCGWDEKTVIVKQLSDQRRNATEAAKLFDETAASLALREQRAAERKAASLTMPNYASKPNKKQRRQIHRFKQDSESD
ncbi:MAG: ribosome-associated heat shock protein Hsp15 [Pseudomonadales bacterium]